MTTERINQDGTIRLDDDSIRIIHDGNITGLWATYTAAGVRARQTTGATDEQCAALDARAREIIASRPATPVAAARPASIPGATVTVAVSSRDFARGVKSAKAMGGRYNAASKTWEIPADRAELGNLGAYGLIRAASRPIEWGEDEDDNIAYWLQEQGR